MDRIHLDCDDLTKAEAARTWWPRWSPRYLKPGTVHFAGMPVAEVRLMDSDLWGDHQYLLDRPSPTISAVLKKHLAARCSAQHDNPSLLLRHGCRIDESADGLYMESSEAGGIWVHAGTGKPAANGLCGSVGGLRKPSSYRSPDEFQMNV